MSWASTGEEAPGIQEGPNIAHVTVLHDKMRHNHYWMSPTLPYTKIKAHRFKDKKHVADFSFTGKPTCKALEVWYCSLERQHRCKSRTLISEEEAILTVFNHHQTGVVLSQGTRDERCHLFLSISKVIQCRKRNLLLARRTEVERGLPKSIGQVLKPGSKPKVAWFPFPVLNLTPSFFLRSATIRNSWIYHCGAAAKLQSGCRQQKTRRCN
ncbi:uncharacterized protein LOC142827643 isoform X2 [Pelodiscus sinensis]|uniref:uncharacterized protein LOC142827643 isoform X2 n=1 Tax=Pelodiscus sinensis TaxID=13735 RepID=UPI003F6C4836